MDILQYHAKFLILDLKAWRPPKPPVTLGGAEGPPRFLERRPGSLDPTCAQARSDRAAREHEPRLAMNMMSNHTDLHEKYCGPCYDMHPIQSEYTKLTAVESAATTKAVARLSAAPSLLWFCLYWF